MLLAWLFLLDEWGFNVIPIRLSVASTCPNGTKLHDGVISIDVLLFFSDQSVKDYHKFVFPDPPVSLGF